MYRCRLCGNTEHFFASYKAFTVIRVDEQGDIQYEEEIDQDYFNIDACAFLDENGGRCESSDIEYVPNY